MMKLRSYLKKVGREESGFTLIELMVVVVILGILGSLVVPRIAGDVTGTAETNADAANMKMIQAAVNRYEAETGGAITSWTNATMKTNLEGTYVDEVPAGLGTDANGKVVEVSSGSGT